MPPNLGAEPFVTHRPFRHGCCFLLVCSTASRQCGLRGVDDVQRHAIALCSECWSLALGSLRRPDRGNSFPHLVRREDLWFPFRLGCCRTAWSDSTSRDRAFQAPTRLCDRRKPLHPQHAVMPIPPPQSYWLHAVQCKTAIPQADGHSQVSSNVLFLCKSPLTADGPPSSLRGSFVRLGLYKDACSEPDRFPPPGKCFAEG